MKLKDELSEEQQKRMVKAGTIFAVAILIIIYVSFYFLFSPQNPFNPSQAINSGVSAFAAMTMILPLIYVAWCFPGVILIEIVDSWVKKRRLKPRNVLILMLLLGELFIITASLFTLFDGILPGISFLIQLPLITASFSAALLITVATMEKTRIKGYVKKAFD